MMYVKNRTVFYLSPILISLIISIINSYSISLGRILSFPFGIYFVCVAYIGICDELIYSSKRVVFIIYLFCGVLLVLYGLNLLKLS